MTTSISSPSGLTGDHQPRPLERLEADIVELASQLTAASARLTQLIGDYDAAEGWRGWGMRSTAHWLSWKCGMGLGAAREQVRVARRLRELPVIAMHYATGRLSYAKVRALSRFATAESDAYLAEMAVNATGAQIEKLARQARRARTGADARGQYAAAYLKVSYDDDGSVIGSFRLPPAEGAELVQALRAGAGRLPDYRSEGDDAGETSGPPKRVSARGYAWVLTAMARQFLDKQIAEATESQAERFQLVLHATPDQVACPDDLDESLYDDPSHAGDGGELANGVQLHSSTLRRLTCDCPTSTLVTEDDGSPLHLGRRTRRITGRLRRAVEARDRGRCRTPGCTEQATQIHHIRHWANGGVTCLPNLISLCDAHHWLMHEGGFTIVPRSPGRWSLLGPEGVVVEPTPPSAPARGVLPHDQRIDADAVTGRWCGDRMTHYAIDVILTSIGAFEPPPPPRPDVSAETFSTAAA